MDNFDKFITPNMLSLTDTYAVKILICFFLKQIDKPVTPQQLLEISTDDGIINYFYYTEAIEAMLEAGTIISERINDKDHYVLSEIGKNGADSFKKLVPKSFRDKILTSGMKLFAKLKLEHDVKCEIKQGEKGCIVECLCFDMDIVLMDLKLFAPDMEQAELIKEKILLNPTDFYGKILDYALENEEFVPDID